MNSKLPTLSSAESTSGDLQRPMAPIPAESHPERAAVTTPRTENSAHDVEREVMHRLQNHPKLKFTRLDVHRCNRDAVCLEGFLESNEDEIDLCEVVRGIHGITNVVNRVVTAHATIHA